MNCNEDAKILHLCRCGWIRFHPIAADESADIGREHDCVFVPGPTAEPGILIVSECGYHFLVRIHHEWAALSHRLADWLSLQHKQLCNADLVPYKNCTRAKINNGMPLDANFIIIRF